MTTVYFKMAKVNLSFVQAVQIHEIKSKDFLKINIRLILLKFRIPKLILILDILIKRINPQIIILIHIQIEIWFRWIIVKCLFLMNNINNPTIIIILSEEE